MRKPSVTELLQLLDKPALLKWANQIGLNGVNIDDFKRKATSAGSSLHKQIEEYLKNQTPFEDIKVQDKFLKFIKDKEVIAFEERTENDYFTGKFDIKLKFNSQVYLCDFKLKKKTVYLENKLQLVAYKMLTGADKLAIISIPDFTLIEVQIEDEVPYTNILINLASIHQSLEILRDRKEIL